MTDDWLDNTLEDIQEFCKLNRLTMLGAVMDQAKRSLKFDRKIKMELSKIGSPKETEENLFE